MMQLNPLFFNSNSELSRTERSIDAKLNNTKYLFSDLIKIKLNNNSKDTETIDSNFADDIDKTTLKEKNVDDKTVSYEYNNNAQSPLTNDLPISSSLEASNLNPKSEVPSNLSNQENSNLNDKIYQNDLSGSKLKKFVSELNKPVSNSAKNNNLIEDKKTKKINGNKNIAETTNKKQKEGIDLTEIIKKVDNNKKVKISLKLEKNIIDKLKNLKGVNLKKLKEIQQNSKVKKSLLIEVSKAKNTSKEGTFYIKDLKIDTLKNKYNVKISINKSITKSKNDNLLKTQFLNEKLMNEFSKPGNLLKQLKAKLTDIFPVNENSTKSSTIAVNTVKNIKNSFHQTRIHSINFSNQKGNDSNFGLRLKGMYNQITIRRQHKVHQKIIILNLIPIRINYLVIIIKE